MLALLVTEPQAYRRVIETWDQVVLGGGGSSVGYDMPILILVQWWGSIELDGSDHARDLGQIEGEGGAGLTGWWGVFGHVDMFDLLTSRTCCDCGIRSGSVE
jgi:hypothetical protein